MAGASPGGGGRGGPGNGGVCVSVVSCSFYFLMLAGPNCVKTRCLPNFLGGATGCH